LKNATLRIGFITFVTDPALFLHVDEVGFTSHNAPHRSHELKMFASCKVLTSVKNWILGIDDVYSLQKIKSLQFDTGFPLPVVAATGVTDPVRI